MLNALSRIRASREDRWGTFLVRRHYRHTGPTDAGEAAALAALGPLDGLAILDLGVGGGRTTALLAPSARAYLGVDISPRLLAAARRRHPDADLRLGDARDMPDAATGAYDLVVFSYNGIDAVAHEERPLVLGEIRRALRPGGRALLSTFNLKSEAIAERERPRLRDLVRTPEPTGWKRPVLRVYQLACGPIAFWNFTAARRGAREGDGWFTWPMAPHEFRFLAHFSRFGRAVAELAAAGLPVERAFDSDGRAVALDRDAHDAGYTHFIVRRP